MKKYIIYITMMLALAFAVLSCNSDTLSPDSIIVDSPIETNELDEWLEKNYLEPYNIAFKYRFEDIESSMSYYLTPASYEQSIWMAKLVLHMCLQAYDEITGSTKFMRSYFPKIIFLVGSYAYRVNGTRVKGTAEAGTKITLYNVDELDTLTITAKTAYFKTLHHEFCHILNNKKSRPTEFNEISAAYYIGDECFDTFSTDESAYIAGFISSYAASSSNEDFAEMISLYINRSASEWESILETAATGTVGDSTGREIIEQKLEYVKDYMSSNWSIDLDDLREIVLRRADEAHYLNFSSLD